MGLIDNAIEALRFKDTIFYKEGSDLQEKYNALKKLNEEYPNNEELINELYIVKKGLDGENEIAYQLKKAHIGMYVLRDIKLKYEDLTAQIDYVIITPVYSYYIECKNLVGNITVTDKGDFIREYTINGKKIKKGMYSPLRQVEAQRENKGAAIADEGVETVHYWIYAPGDGAMYWDEFYSAGIMGIGWDDIGDLSAYNTKSEMRQAMQEKIDPSRSFKNDAHATWQFVNEMKPGDIIFAKKGMHQVIGRGVVGSDYEFDPQRDHYKNIRQVKWTHKGEWQHPGQAVMKTLTDITAYTDYVEKLNSLFESEIEDDIEEPVEIDLKPYDADMFLEEVYMDKNKYDTLVALVEKKKNVILQGAPGVGKTFAAKRLAYSIMGVKDPSRVMMVQFHQSYSYEDFIMGFRPTQEGGFELKHGAFYDFCKSAEVDSEDTPYFFIIDEINRGNLSKIFGELFMLIESDKRGIELKLLYADEKFSVPKNVYIIGMMNTADRSLAMMDYALRRRFAFFDMDPGFNTKGFRQYQEGLQSEKFNKLIERVESLNADIASDDSLGEGFCIGHSYFCELKETSDQTLSGIVEFELAPLLKEYWFDEPAKAKTWIEDLRSAIK